MYKWMAVSGMERPAWQANEYMNNVPTLRVIHGDCSAWAGSKPGLDPIVYTCWVWLLSSLTTAGMYSKSCVSLTDHSFCTWNAVLYLNMWVCIFSSLFSFSFPPTLYLQCTMYKWKSPYHVRQHSCSNEASGSNVGACHVVASLPGWNKLGFVQERKLLQR